MQLERLSSFLANSTISHDLHVHKILAGHLNTCGFVYWLLTWLSCIVIWERSRAYCKMCGFWGKCALEIKTDLELVYGKNALPYLKFTSGYQCFRKVELILRMIPPCRRYRWKKETVKAIVDEDARCILEEISDISVLSASYLFSIVKEKLKEWVEKASALWTRFRDQDPRRLREIVTGDETWLFFSPTINSVTKCG